MRILKTCGTAFYQFSRKNDFFWHLFTCQDMKQRLHELMRQCFQAVIHRSQFRRTAGRENGIVIADDGKIFRNMQAFALCIFDAADCQRIIGSEQTMKINTAFGNAFHKVCDILYGIRLPIIKIGILRRMRNAVFL